MAIHPRTPLLAVLAVAVMWQWKYQECDCMISLLDRFGCSPLRETEVMPERATVTGYTIKRPLHGGTLCYQIMGDEYEY